MVDAAILGAGLWAGRMQLQHDALTVVMFIAVVMFEQTAEALAGAIDAKDTYTNGHSRRVALYSYHQRLISPRRKVLWYSVL